MALRMHLIQNARNSVNRIAPTMMNSLKLGPVYNRSDVQNEANVYVT